MKAIKATISVHDALSFSAPRSMLYLNKEEERSSINEFHILISFSSQDMNLVPRRQITMLTYSNTRGVVERCTCRNHHSTSSQALADNRDGSKQTNNNLGMPLNLRHQPHPARAAPACFYHTYLIRQTQEHRQGPRDRSVSIMTYVTAATAPMLQRSKVPCVLDFACNMC